jgi:hypothetical protein
MIAPPMKFLLITALACSSLACSDEDSPNTDAGDAPVDARVSVDSGDVLIDRVDSTTEVGSDRPADATDASTPDLPAPAMLEITPAVHDFGTVAKDQPVMQQFKVKNTGGSASGSLDMKLMNGTLDPDGFAIASNSCDSTLEPDDTCEMEIRFSANVVGVHQGLLTATASPGGMASAELKATVP